MKRDMKVRKKKVPHRRGKKSRFGGLKTKNVGREWGMP